MKHWIRLQVQAMTATFRQLLAQPIATLLSLAMIAVSVALPLGLFMLLQSVGQLAGKLPSTPEATLFARAGAIGSEIGRIELLIKSDANVAKYRHIDKQAALAELEASSGMSGLMAGLGENPLPDSFVITPRDTTPAALDAMAARLKADPSVDTLQLDTEWARRLEALIGVGREITLTLAVLVLLGLLLVTANLVRMQILTRSDEIEVSKLIGATDGFIRRPFLYFAAIQGALGALAGIALVVFGLFRLGAPLDKVAQLYGDHFTPVLPDIEVVLLTLLLVVLMSLGGAALSVRKHLRALDA